MKTKTVFTEDYVLLLDLKDRKPNKTLYNGCFGIILNEDGDTTMADSCHNIIAYRKRNPQADNLALPLLPESKRVYWIAEVKFKDGTILKSDKFYEYDSGIKVWSAKFSGTFKDNIEYINYNRFTENISIDVDIEQLSKEYVDKEYPLYAFKESLYNVYKEGFKKAQEINNDKQFTLEEIENAIKLAREYTHDGAHGDNFHHEDDDIIKQLKSHKEFILGDGDSIEEKIKHGLWM